MIAISPSPWFRRDNLAVALCWILGLAAAGPHRAAAAVVITEVMYDTVGVESGGNVGEWVEVYNTGPGSVDLTGWRLEKDNTIDGVGFDLLTLVQGAAVLAPGQFALIVPGGDAAASTAPLLETWHIPERLTVFSCNWTGTRNLGNSGETIALRNAANAVADMTTYPDLGANLGSVQVAVAGLDPTTNDNPANWAQSTISNAYFCVDPFSVGVADFGYFDSVITNHFWDGPEEQRDLGTPGRFPTHLKYSTRYFVDYGAPLVSTRDQVRTAVINSVILPGANSAMLCAYDLPKPFPAGTLVSAADGQAPTRVLPATAWLVWLDDDPQSEFTHPTRIVLVDDATLATTVLSAGWWPEMNGEPYFEFEEDRLCSSNKFWGQCCSPISPPPAAPELVLLPSAGWNPEASAAPGANKACAIGISGSSESHFGKNVDNFLQGLVDKGLVDAARTKKVKYPKSTLKNICKALMDLPTDCDKLYVYVASHGGVNSISVPGGGLTAKKLACKLKDLKVPSYCIVLQACHSGSNIDELKGKKLPGFVTTSADTNHTSKFKPGEYLYFTKYLIDCLKVATNTNLKEAAAWAKKQHKKERPKDNANPQCTDLVASIAIKGGDTGTPEEQCRLRNQPFTFQFETEDTNNPATWSLAPPGLPPPGLSLAPNGLLSGTLFQPGQFDYVVQVMDCCSTEPAALPFFLCVQDNSPSAPPPLRVDPQIAPALVGVPYHFPIGIRGGIPPYVVQINYASMPPQFFLIQNGPDAGTIMTMPEQESGAELTIRVMDSAPGSMQQFALRNMTFSAMQPSPPPAPTIAITLNGNNVIVSWDDPNAVLFQANEVTGPWAQVIGAPNPYVVPHPLQARQFFQVGLVTQPAP